ncbi:hypothetical protein EZV73_00610 [Acidaminobacter sp. JC074]|uniref:ATP-binding protein n=1 Tax=Acidaminobacter sp. JC074 TaxID=2530199 RepID=UPI001F0D1FA8|nr:ATP-binding protein [Acidaminobacter sp. JC074]MCH4886041.1 hypothetical protein [Acidaminobacter sp. JC074]
MKKKSLKTELMLESVIYGMLAIVIVSIIVTFVLFNFIENEQYKKNSALSRAVAYQLDSYFMQPSDVLNELKETLYLSDYITDNHKQDFVDSIVENISKFSSVLILDDSGTVLFSSPENPEIIGIDHSSYPYFLNVKEAGKVYWSSAFFAFESKYPQVGISMKVEDEIMVAILDMQSFASHIYDMDLGDKSIITVTDDKGNYVAHTDMDTVFLRGVDQMYQTYSSGNIPDTVSYKGLDYIPIVETIEERNWVITVLQSSQTFYKPISQMLIVSIITTLLILVLVYLLSKRRVNKLMVTVNDLTEASEIISSGSYQHQVKDSQYYEFNQLSMAFNKMSRDLDIITNNLEKQVKDRTLELSKANEDLKTSLNTLKETQAKLVESEKLASLGQLVTGVAHEINTPIGVAFTMTSYLKELTQITEEKISNKTITKRHLDNHIESTLKTLLLLENSLHQSTQLIASFKQLSIDESSAIKKEFSLESLINNVLLQNENKIKESGINLNLSIRDVHLNSYPLELEKVLNGLIKNAITHGQPKNITIISLVTDKVQIKVKDDGLGMDNDVLEKIFHHFFTTSRSEGVGLGLTIIYHMITNLLNGTIEVNSEPQNGTEFIITLPID